MFEIRKRELNNEKTISICVSGYQKSNKLNKQFGVEYYQKKCQNYRHDKR